MSTKWNAGAAPILVFDVNETLLDVNAALRPQFEHLFKDGAVLKEWFAQMLLYSQTVTQTGQYADFGMLGRAALRMVAEIHGVEPTEHEITAVIQSMRSLPAYPEVAEQLRRLHESGFRIVALTNSAEDAAKAQIENAGLADRFERIFSIDAVRKYKPAGEPYRYVADELGVETSHLTMIAAHPWDLIGAKAAGCEVAFIQRSGTAWFPLTSAPAIIGTTLNEVADRLLIRARPV